jgi:cytochrome c biogenesis protein CcdA
MDIREYLVDILLTVVMIIASLVLITRFWQDLIIAVAAGLMTIALGGLLLSLNIKMRHLERSVVIRERMLRTNLEEISDRMQGKYDMALSHLDELIGEFSRRSYR